MAAKSLAGATSTITPANEAWKMRKVLGGVNVQNRCRPPVRDVPNIRLEREPDTELKVTSSKGLRGVPELGVRQIAQHVSQIDAVEDVEGLHAEFDVGLLTAKPGNGSVFCERHIGVRITRSGKCIAPEVSFLSQGRCRKIRSGKQTVDKCGSVAVFGVSEGGSIRDVVVETVGIVVATGVTDDGAGGVVHRFESSGATDGEGRSGLQDGDIANLPSTGQALGELGIEMEFRQFATPS